MIASILMPLLLPTPMKTMHQEQGEGAVVSLWLWRLVYHVILKCQLTCAYHFGDRGIWVLSDCRTGPFLRSMKKALLSVVTLLAFLSLPFGTSLSLVGCFFLGALCAELQRSPDHPFNRFLCWKGASSRQEKSPSSSTLTLLCPSCLPMPGTSWDNTGTGAKLVTSNCYIKAESCIHSLLTHLCSVLGVFRFLYFLRVSHVLGPNILLLKLLLWLVKKPEKKSDVAEAPRP